MTCSARRQRSQTRWHPALRTAAETMHANHEPRVTGSGNVYVQALRLHLFHVVSNTYMHVFESFK